MRTLTLDEITTISNLACKKGYEQCCLEQKQSKPLNQSLLQLSEIASIMKPIEVTQELLCLKHPAPPTCKSPSAQYENNDNCDDECTADYLDRDEASLIDNVKVPPPTNNDPNDSASSVSNSSTSETATNDSTATLDLDSNADTNSNSRSASLHASALIRDLNKY